MLHILEDLGLGEVPGRQLRDVLVVGDPWMQQGLLSCYPQILVSLQHASQQAFGLLRDPIPYFVYIPQYVPLNSTLEFFILQNIYCLLMPSNGGDPHNSTQSITPQDQISHLFVQLYCNTCGATQQGEPTFCFIFYPVLKKVAVPKSIIFITGLRDSLVVYISNRIFSGFRSR